MESISTQDFSRFAGQILVSYSNRSSNNLASFALEISDSTIEGRIINHARTYEKSFYWEVPNSDVMYLALGELLSVVETGKGRYAATEKKVKAYKEQFRSNFDELGLKGVPLFFGGMKFSSDNSSEMWENYPDSGWIVPKFLYMKVSGRPYLIYNFLVSHDAKPEKLVSEFSSRISLFLGDLNKESSKTDSTAGIRAAVVSVAGNTPKDKKKWIESTKKAIEQVESGELDKVVMSRYVELTLNNNPDIVALLSELRQRYPECFIFSYHSGRSTFFGASPERLARFSGNLIEADALAGSAPRGCSEAEDNELASALLNDEKNLREHRAVVKFICSVFSALGGKVHFKDEPVIKRLQNIQHLWTPIRVETQQTKGALSILEMLHPTPAVCGLPQQEAYAAIRKNEYYTRGLYSGIVGWFNLENEGEFAVALRSALSKGRKLYAFAGGGIVEGSEASSEYKETELKLKPILSLFTNEN